MVDRITEFRSTEPKGLPENSNKVMAVLSAGLTRACTNPEDLFIQEIDRDTTRKMLGSIPLQGQEIIARRFGLGCPRQGTKAVAKELGLPVNEVIRRERKALSALRYLAQQPPFRDVFSL